MQIYEAGTRNSDGKYTQFIESNSEKKVDDYIEIMKVAKVEILTIVKLIKTYNCVSTTPYIID